MSVFRNALKKPILADFSMFQLYALFLILIKLSELRKDTEQKNAGVESNPRDEKSVEESGKGKEKKAEQEKNVKIVE